MKKLKQPILHSKTRPLVTVLIYNYNYGKYLTECFESVLNQTYNNIEISFSDNSSFDVKIFIFS